MTPEERGVAAAAAILDFVPVKIGADYVVTRDEHITTVIAAAVRAAVAEERVAILVLARDLAPADPTDSRFRGASEVLRRLAAAVRARPS